MEWSCPMADEPSLTALPGLVDYSPEAGKLKQRRASAPYEQLQPQYSVQGSTSTPNSVGPSSGTASPMDNCISQHSNDCCAYSNSYDQLDMVGWPDKSLFEDMPGHCSAPSSIKFPALGSFNNNSSPALADNYSDTGSSRSISVRSPFGDVSVSDHSIEADHQPVVNQVVRKKKDKKHNSAKKSECKSETSGRPQAKSIVSAITKRRLKIRKFNKGDDPDAFRLPLSELTVEDLKVICRKHNFAISGTKADLFRRLEPIESTLDIEGILMDAIMDEENASVSEQESPEQNGQAGDEKPNKTNKFNVAISDYLMQHQKQIDEGLKLKPGSSVSCTFCHCANSQSSSATSKTFTLNNAALGPPATLSSALKVPVIPTSKIVTPRESEKEAQTFSYAEMGSGGRFTFEPTLVDIGPCAEAPQNAKKAETVKKPAKSEPCECKKEWTESEARFRADDLTDMTNDLPRAKDLSDKPQLTARMLAMHERLIALQQKRIQDLSQAIRHSQRALHCQQKLLETARKFAKDKSVAPVEALLSKSELAKLKRQHMQQCADHRSVQHTEQKIASDQKQLTQKEVGLQEEIHIEQAVEDVARLIRTNRRTALLIVQLVHKFQLERKQEFKEWMSKPSTADCKCTSPEAAQEAPHADVVVIDESDDEFKPKRREGKKPRTKKKAKPGAKKAVPKDRNFAAVMEDIFQTVISDSVPAEEPKAELGLDAEVGVYEPCEQLVYGGAFCAPLPYHSAPYAPPAPPMDAAEPAYAAYEYQAAPAAECRAEALAEHVPPPSIHPPGFPYRSQTNVLHKLAEKRRSLCEQLEELEKQERQISDPFSEFACGDRAADLSSIQVADLGVYEFESAPQSHAEQTHDFEDIMDLIRNGDRNKPALHNSEECAQATNAIYQELMLTDNQFQAFTPLKEMENYV